MEMWCPVDIGRHSWDWVGPPTWEREHASTPRMGWRLLASPDCISVVVVIVVVCCCGCFLIFFILFHLRLFFRFYLFRFFLHSSIFLIFPFYFFTVSFSFNFKVFFPFFLVPQPQQVLGMSEQLGFSQAWALEALAG